jgi:hypothetical protein
MKTIAAIVLCVALSGCASSGKVQTPESRLASAEVALTTAVGTADAILTAECDVPKSDKCGKALDWHEKFLATAKIGQTGILTARAYLNKDPALVGNILTGVLANVDNLNTLIKGH